MFGPARESHKRKLGGRVTELLREGKLAHTIPLESFNDKFHHVLPSRILRDFISADIFFQ
jgi:hypothetical protein